MGSETSDDAYYGISIGETIEIKLKANATTGYSWNWVNEDLITVVGSLPGGYVVESVDDDGEMICGAGGTEILKFVGKTAGKETIVLHYSRSWENQKPVRVFTVVLEVK